MAVLASAHGEHMHTPDTVDAPHLSCSPVLCQRFFQRLENFSQKELPTLARVWMMEAMRCADD